MAAGLSLTPDQLAPAMARLAELLAARGRRRRPGPQPPPRRPASPPAPPRPSSPPASPPPAPTAPAPPPRAWRSPPASPAPAASAPTTSPSPSPTPPAAASTPSPSAPPTPPSAPSSPSASAPAPTSPAASSTTSSPAAPAPSSRSRTPPPRAKPARPSHPLRFLPSFLPRVGPGSRVAERDRAKRGLPLTPARLAAPRWKRRLDEAAASSGASPAALPSFAKTPADDWAAARAQRPKPARRRRAAPAGRRLTVHELRCICVVHGLCMPGACQMQA